jgi:hypothetical protein
MKSEQLLSDRGEPDAVGGHHTQEVVEVKCSASSQLPMLGSSWPVAPPTCCAVGGLVRRSSGRLDSEDIANDGWSPLHVPRDPRYRATFEDL